MTFLFLSFFQLNMDMPKLSLVNDFLFMVTFFICRVLMMPFCYWRVGLYFDIPFLSVPFFIPFKCNVMSAIFWGMQLHWFWKIFKKMLQVIRGSKTNNQRTSDEMKSHLSTNGKLNGHEINCNNHYHSD